MEMDGDDGRAGRWAARGEGSATAARGRPASAGQPPGPGGSAGPGGPWPPPQAPPIAPGQPGWGPPPAQAGGQWGPPPQPAWPAPQGPPAGGDRGEDPKPGAATLLAVTVWRVAIGGAALYFATDEGGVGMSDESLSKLSNLGVGWCYLALALYPLLVGGRRHEPRTGWLRGALTVMMLLVFFVFIPGMGNEPDGPHAVVPALVLVDWLFVGRNQFRTRLWEPPTWTVFLLAYLFYHQSNDLPLYDEILGEDNIGTMVPLLLGGTVVVAYVLHGAALLRRAVSRPS